MKISALKGFSDILPGEIESWRFVEEQAREVFTRYNFSEIRIPILEKTELFSRSLGETTDIVEKEMYTFADQDAKGSLLTLRPEGTAGVVRAYVEAELYKTEPQSKLFYIGPMFRRERPQKGRLRQFHQIGAEILGRGDPIADAELLMLLKDFFSRVGLEGLTLELNSLGCVQCRPRYRRELLAFLKERGKQLCPNCQRRMERNPLRVLDCKEESCGEATRDAPSILDDLCLDCKGHFEMVRGLVQKHLPAYRLNHRMVRGLDYYCRTAFEWTSDRLGSQNAVAAGGRYDGLVEDLGGPATPGVGFAIGMERLVSLVDKERGGRLDVYVAWIGVEARGWAFALAQQLREGGMSAEMDGDEKSLKSQMRRADKLRARFVLMVGEDELKGGKATLRDMDTKGQEQIGLDRAAEIVLARK